MTCAMDWTYVGVNPTFYDVWVVRTLTGETFFHISPDGSWDWAWKLFWNDESSKRHFDSKWPFQVFACWNGAVAFTAAPVLGIPRRINSNPDSNEDTKAVSFRSSLQGECYGGEPTLFCKDLWRADYGRIAVLPSVNLEYSNEAERRIKAEKGYVSQWA
jgi:alpha-1,3-mannosyltransferase